MCCSTAFPRTVGDRCLGAEDLSDGRRLIDPVPVAICEGWVSRNLATSDCGRVLGLAIVMEIPSSEDN